MKISYNWLHQYIPSELKLAIEDIAELLTDSGLEVEGIEKIEAVKGGLKGLIIGRVISKEKHPDADKLSLTQVDIGSSETLTIVCGAANVASGQKVVVAPVGCTIYPTKGEPFTIKRAKIRGVESQGMICAEDEIGLGEDHSGILVLSEEAQIGSLAKDYFNVKSDYLLELNLTPNRADAMSHFGVARDLLAVYNCRNSANFQLVRTKIQSGTADKLKSGPIQVVVENKERCPRYAGIYIKNLKVAPSPEWLQQCLRTIGLRPINNVVDITNYICHSLGQPLHAFDADKIKGNTIRVKTCESGTTFVSLDGISRSLHPDDLMICDESEAMCIAGVFGGLHSGVSEETRNIFLESAYFNPVSVRKTAKRHALSTDSSFRFERGIDPQGTFQILRQAADMITSICGGELVDEGLDIVDNIPNGANVSFSMERCEKFLGCKLDSSLVEKIFKQLEIDILTKNDGIYKLKVPAYRVDVERECDIFEEILRILSFNSIEIPSKTAFSVAIQRNPEPEKWINTAAQYLSSLGFNEVMNNSLTKEQYHQWLGGSEIRPENNVPIINPLSSELNVLRQSLLFQNLENISFNLNRKNERLRFYEFGRVYRQLPEGQYQESARLFLSLSGQRFEESWNQSAEKFSFFDLKEVVQRLLNRLGIQSWQEKDSESEVFEYGLSLYVGKRLLGNLGKIKGNLLQKFDIKQEVYGADFDWQSLFELASSFKTQYKSLNKYPSVRRDLSLLIDKTLRFEQIEALARKQEKNLLQSVNLFDVYEGKNLPEGKKSYALSFIMEDRSKTLTDAEIEAVMSKIQNALINELGAQLRN